MRVLTLNERINIRSVLARYNCPLKTRIFLDINEVAFSLYMCRGYRSISYFAKGFR